jgi:hypothetical protein
VGLLQRIWEAGSPHAPSAMTKESEAQRLATSLETIRLSEPYRGFLIKRYVEAVDAFDRAARWNLKLHHVLRLVATIAGVASPALLGLSLTTEDSATKWVAFAFTLITATALATDTLFGFGDRWSHHRKVAEALKSEGWLYIQLADRYTGFTHEEARAGFAEQVERLAREQVTRYVEEIAPLRETGREPERPR